MTNATDQAEYIRNGFAELIERLDGITAGDKETRAKANAVALEREQARVRAEYIEAGQLPPHPLALSLTAIRELNQIHADKQPVEQRQEAAE